MSRDQNKRREGEKEKECVSLPPRFSSSLKRSLARSRAENFVSEAQIVSFFRAIGAELSRPGKKCLGSESIL